MCDVDGLLVYGAPDTPAGGTTHECHGSDARTLSRSLSTSYIRGSGIDSDLAGRTLVRGRERRLVPWRGHGGVRCGL